MTIPKPPNETRILIVDDEPLFRNALVLSLKRKGYQVLEACTGNQAFDLIRTNPVDMVISDVQMPGGTGVELLDRVRAESVEAPVILLVTGFAELSTEDALNKGAEALFGKPFDRKVLEDTIARLLTPREVRWSRGAEQLVSDLKGAFQFEGSDEVEATVASLGRGGMFVALPQLRCPDIGEVVTFRIAFGRTDGTSHRPGGIVQGEGIVRWVRIKESPALPSGCGIEFTYLGESELKQVMEFLSANVTKAYIPSK